MKLEVTPRPVIRKQMELPKTQFNEKETLTIVCQFDARPEEPFIFLHNEQPIVPDNRVSTTVEDKKYTIVVKDLRPEEDEGVYTLKSDHLILDTPTITVVPEEEKPQTETTTVEEDEETITFAPKQHDQPETLQKVGSLENTVKTYFAPLLLRSFISRRLKKKLKYPYMKSKKTVT